MSRLLVSHPNGTISHVHFRNIIDFLPPDSVLVINDTRVMPARMTLTAHQHNMEFLFLESQSQGGIISQLKGLLRLRKRLSIGDPLHVHPMLSLTYAGKDPNDPAISILTPRSAVTESEWHIILHTHGHMPLPPYITREDTDEDRSAYQTVYAKHLGAVAAPTAGLHFTPELFRDIAKRNITIAPITLHVGYGTFRPIRAGCITDHQMHAERYYVPSESWRAISAAKHVVAVGTTTVRALESFVRNATLDTWLSTDLFITPGFSFRTVTHMITNFHLPKSTLLCLVYAFGGPKRMHAVYEVAIRHQYRFYSYGDAMLLTREDIS